MTGFAQWPDYRIDILRRPNRVTASVGDTLVADTTAALLVDEQDHGLVFYFPRADVRVELRPDPSVHTHCPFKGEAAYWRFDGDGGGEPVCWSYDDPTPQTELLRGHVAFVQDRVAVRVGR